MKAMFSSPFIEERLYLQSNKSNKWKNKKVLVPFYRGAVVFKQREEEELKQSVFSSPFIEERLYLVGFVRTVIFQD